MYQKKYNLFLIKQTKKKYQNLQDVAKEVLRAKFSVMNACIREEERSHVKKPNFIPQVK